MLGEARRKKQKEKREEASKIALLTDDALLGRLQWGLLAIDRKKE